MSPGLPDTRPSSSTSKRILRSLGKWMVGKRLHSQDLEIPTHKIIQVNERQQEKDSELIGKRFYSLLKKKIKQSCAPIRSFSDGAAGKSSPFIMPLFSSDEMRSDHILTPQRGLEMSESTG